MVTVVVGTTAPVISPIYETTPDMGEILLVPVINQELPEAHVVQRVQEHLGETIKVIAQEYIAERIVDIQVSHLRHESPRGIPEPTKLVLQEQTVDVDRTVAQSMDFLVAQI